MRRLQIEVAAGQRCKRAAEAVTGDHLTLTADGREMLHDWRTSETVARSKLTAWLGHHGERPEAHVTLTDERGTGG